MEYITRKFENTRAGLNKKDAVTRELAAEGYRITSEQIEQGHIKGEEQCCGALICLPLIFLAGRTPGTIVVTYGREDRPPVSLLELYCTNCGARVAAGASMCQACGGTRISSDRKAALLLAEKNQTAREKTAQAQASISALNNVLIETIQIDHRFDWGATIKQYQVARPVATTITPLSNEPRLADFDRPPFFVKLIPSIRRKRSLLAQQRFFEAKKAWEQEKERIDLATATGNEEYERALSMWKANKEAFDKAQAATVESNRNLYFAKDPIALKEYWWAVISKSKLPAGLSMSYDFSYDKTRRALVADCGLPTPDAMPRVQEVKYDENKKAFEESLFPRSWQHDSYEQMVYNLALKTLYELFQSDSANALEEAVFSGFVKGMDRAVGHEVQAYIISIHARKQEFLAFNLAHVDPKACVRRLKGRASESMSELVPIEPIDLP